MPTPLPLSHWLTRENKCAKLTPAQVAQIRKLYKKRSADANCYTLAAQFGVAYNTIHQIVTYRTWKRLP